MLTRKFPLMADEPVDPGASAAPAEDDPNARVPLWVIRADARAGWLTGFVQVLTADVDGLVADGIGFDPATVYPLPEIIDTPNSPQMQALYATFAIAGAAAPDSVPADGASTSALSFTVTKDGTPAPGVLVSLSPVMGMPTLSAPSGYSDAQGVVTVDVTDTRAGSDLIYGSILNAAHTASASITFTAPGA
jgi:hypothetical protein